MRYLEEHYPIMSQHQCQGRPQHLVCLVRKGKRKGMSLDQWAFQVHSAVANHPEVALRESIIRSLKGVAADLV